MSSTAAQYLYHGLALSTRSSYSAGTNSYFEFCAMRDIHPAIPTAPLILIEWCAFLADTRKLPHKTIKGYLTAVKSAHIDRGVSRLDVFQHPVLQRLVRGIKKQQGGHTRRERLPITNDVLVKLIKEFDTTTEFGATMHAAFCLAHAGFLRVGEFTYGQADLEPDFDKHHVTRSCLKFRDGSLELYIPASKTDAFREGVTLKIAAAPGDACPVQSLKNLYSRVPALPQAPLFVLSARPFTRDLVVDTLHDRLVQCGIRGNYSGHSFRRGAATDAKRAGLSTELIKRMGRWKSDAYQLYIDLADDTILEASRRHQLVQG